MRVHDMIVSRANGPGLRATIWVQGCTLGCPGCFNGPTHPNDGGKDMSVQEVFDWIKAQCKLGIEGVSITGGEPLQQKREVTELLRRVRMETGLTAILFTGYSVGEIEKMPQRWFMSYTDVLLAGRYDQAKHAPGSLRGSSNKKSVFLTDRYNEQDLEAVPESEVRIMPDGSITISGIAPIRLTV